MWPDLHEGMTNRQGSKLAMLISVVTALEKHREKISSHEGLTEAADELSSTVAAINETAQDQVARDGSAEAKALALTQLGDAAFEAAAAVRACAAAAGNRQLAGRVDFSRWEVTRGRPGTVTARCQAILAAATENAAAVIKYGVTAAKLTALREKIENYQAVCPKPREGRVSSSTATRKLPELFQQADTLLVEQLDGLVIQFKEAQPEFFNDFSGARVIVDSAASRTANDAAAKKTSTATSTPDSNPSVKAAA